MLTYPDGRQDVGLWHRQKLARLCAPSPGAFTLANHPDLDWFPEEHEIYLTTTPLANRNDLINDVANPPELFDYPPSVNISRQTPDIFSDTLNFHSTAVDVKIFEEEFFKICETEKGESVKAWNNTPSMVAMQRHILRYLFFVYTASVY